MDASSAEFCERKAAASPSSLLASIELRSAPTFSARINQLAQSYGMVQVQPGRGAYLRLHPGQPRPRRPKQHAARQGAAAVSFARHVPAGKP